MTTTFGNSEENSLRNFFFIFVSGLLLISQNAFSDELPSSALQKALQKNKTGAPLSKQAQVQPSSVRDTPSLAPTSLRQETRPQTLGGSSGNGVGIGPAYDWQIRPRFDFTTTYDSNVNREPPGQRNEDVILNYTPSIEVLRHGNRYEVAAGYSLNFQEYLRDPDQNAFNHDAYTRLRHTTGKLTTSIDEHFSLAKTYASSEQAERREILTNDFGPEVAYRLSPKISVAAVYKNHLFKYLDSILEESSYIQNDIGGRVYYHAKPKLDFYLQGSGIMTNYSQSDTLDSNGFKALGGALGRVTPKVTVNLETGFKNHTYENSGTNDYNDWVLLAALEYQATPKLKSSMFLKRDKEESVYRNVGWYESNAVGTAFNYQLTGRIALSAGATAQWNSYPIETTEVGLTKKRQDFILATHSDLKWNPREYVTFRAGYKLLLRQSNFDNTFEYVDHVIDASVSLGFA